VFERHVVVDWSANSAPKRGRDSIWIAIHDGARCRLENPSTRAAAEHLLCDLLHSDHVPTLLGVDFSLGYPAGTAERLGLVGSPWAAMACMLAGTIVDRPDNRNNRFEAASRLNQRMSDAATPFWGCPRGRATPTLGPTKPVPPVPPAPLAEWRLVEEQMRLEGLRPFSSWQLTGAGAVGSQSLMGIPMIMRLIETMPRRADVWPMTTGLQTPRLTAGSVVIVEVWPSMLPAGVRDQWAGDGRVRDAAQVAATAAWMRDLGDSGRLTTLFAPELNADVRRAVEAEEGWVLGVAG
jgi:hypothetical protein